MTSVCQPGRERLREGVPLVCSQCLRHGLPLISWILEGKLERERGYSYLAYQGGQSDTLGKALEIGKIIASSLYSQTSWVDLLKSLKRILGILCNTIGITSTCPHLCDQPPIRLVAIALVTTLGRALECHAFTVGEITE